MPRGGARPGAGRPRKSGKPPGPPKPLPLAAGIPKDKAEREKVKRQAEIILIGLDLPPEKRFTGNALAFLTAVYQNSTLPAEMRIVAARAAAPFESPRLSLATVTLRQVGEMTEEECLAALGLPPGTKLDDPMVQQLLNMEQGTDGIWRSGKVV